MFGRIQKIIFSVLLCGILLASMSIPAMAQTTVPSGAISLADLGVTELRLIGSFDTETLVFGLPATWRANAPAQLSLNTSVVFGSAAPQDGQSFHGGTLTVSFNRNTVAILSMDSAQVGVINIDIPAEYLVSPRADGRMELRFELDSGVSCLISEHMTILIRSDSRIVFNYEEVLPDVSLSAFPRPIYQNSVFPDSAFVVIPDQPTSAEVQSAYTVAAGISNITSGEVALSMMRASDLTDQQKTSSHLIYVGKMASFPRGGGLIGLPMAATNGKFPLTNEDNGVVQMVNSPWSKSSVALVVSGNTDAGVVKAAQAVSTGSFIASVAPNLAVIENVQDTIPVTPLISDQTLGDMGFQPAEFNRRGLNSDTYSFLVPSGNTVSSDAVFDLAYGHSALMNYDLSGMVILLNGKPVGSVQFAPETAKQAINHNLISIPASLIVPGRNTIEVRASLEPMDNCVDPNLRGLWAVVWPESRLYLPFVPTPVNTTLGLDLGLYPAPMVFNPTLSDTAFIMPRENAAVQALGLQIAYYLGDRANGPISEFRVFFDDEVKSADLAPYHVIVLGPPSQLTVMEALKGVIPVPFEKGSDVAQNKYSQILYEIPVNAPIGYLELFPSPWSSEKTVIAALGNTAQGVAWAASSLYDPNLRSQLTGDFAVISNDRVQSVDTRLAIPMAVAQATPEPGTPSDPSAPSGNTAPITDRPNWIFPMLVVAILFAAVLIGVVYLNWRKENARKE